MPVSRLFPTKIFLDQKRGAAALNAQLLREIEDLAELDGGGVAWSKKNYLNGFTSYGSANELHKTSSTFAGLREWIDSRVLSYAKSLDLDLGRGRLEMSNCWANVMFKNTHHTWHIHPLAVISGTYYVSLPKGSPAIKFEDPRLPFFMHAPPRKERARKENHTYVSSAAKPGGLILFESWLRHEVPMHEGRAPRVSVSFNYDWV